MSGALPFWVIYARPSDLPAMPFVARRWAANDRVRASGEIICATDVEHIRTVMRSLNLTCLGRNAQDDPAIVETWV